ncbi:hypothetical protein F4805DRAFT_471946 [Annulohypoxylon moriforme]|nr:hypothetical protein F4805DRAFT_471946 [Annulohypoxylon moriforme]
MGRLRSISAEIEIQAPPATVRSVFLNFSEWSQWHQGWIINPVDSNKTPFQLVAGDRLRVNMHGMVFHPTVKGNSAECFEWEGTLTGILVGRHRFSFLPSKKNPGGTTLVQVEDFEGILTFLFKQGSSSSAKTIRNWDAFNADLKSEIEKSLPGV